MKVVPPVEPLPEGSEGDGSNAWGSHLVSSVELLLVKPFFWMGNKKIVFLVAIAVIT